MNFETIIIKNFRNFKDITVALNNKNVFFGLNDVGKTNFLYAIRYLLDKDLRKLNFIDSDFHNKNIKENIEIIMIIDIDDEDCIDNQKLRAALKGTLSSTDTKAHIKLIGEFIKTELVAIPELYWGGNIDNLQKMNSNGYLYDIDKLINIVHIDSYVELNKLFKKNAKHLIKNENCEDVSILNQISNNINSINNNIDNLSGIINFRSKITNEYNKLTNQNIDIEIKSEIAIKNLYANLIPYIKYNNDENLYPTSGEGRRKLLVYAIYDLIADENKFQKINILLIEEPENHLHKSLQIALSKMIFNDLKYQYLFATTHSPYFLHEMNNVNLIRIFNKTKINSASYFYKVPSDFERNRNILNSGLTEAIFADNVLLVEGPSEVTLFKKVLSVTNPFFEANGGYILDVKGIAFDKYYNTLTNLEIKTLIKTDNDFKVDSSKKKYDTIGFTRCNKFIINGCDHLPNNKQAENTVNSKINLYNENKCKLDKIRKDYKIFLSKCDLENDLDEFLNDELKILLGKDPVKYLQSSKHYNMVELVCKLTDDNCKKIYNHYNFECLKEVCDGLL